MIGEPLCRPDGQEIILWEWDSGGVELHFGGRPYFYGNESIERFGEGNPNRAYIAIGRAAYNATADEHGFYTSRPTPERFNY
jgi:hypothetical protein